MTIFYIDLDNGSDAAAGTSWGTAWKTFQNGATAARIAPGDEIRCSQTAASASVGSATWTNAKVGNSITFSSAPTKQINTCKSGWVTLGAGSTVTNAQTTAYMTPVAFAGTTMGALQITTSAAANLGYKSLGSSQDFSGQQQISFWFRTSATFDCTGAQNMTVTLCSDTAGVTAVDTFTLPKWNYAANMWYPIVIDKGSAASSGIQSVAIRTTSNTSQTFYFDEMFASPAAGLTLRSLIGLNDGYWHAIRSIRGADVQLLASFNAATAAGGTVFLASIDSAWMGTTTTATTYKLEPSTALIPTSGPAANAGGVTVMEAGTAALPNIFRGGWDVGTGLQTGVTFLDNVTHSTSSVGLNFATSATYTIVENFGLVRFSNTAVSSVNNYVTKDISIIATPGSQGNSTMTVGFPAAAIALGYTSWGWKQLSGCYNMPSYYIGAYIPTNTVSFNIGQVWGCTTNATGLNFNFFVGVPINVGAFYPGACANTILSLGCTQCTVTFGDYKMCATSATSGNTLTWLTITGNNNNIKFGDINVNIGTAPSWSGANNVVTINSLTSSGLAMINTPGPQNVVYLKNANISNTVLQGSGGSDPRNNKIYFHNYGGTNGYFRAYVVDGNAASGYFELQGTDVYTPGSKAVRYNTSTFAAGGLGLGTTFDLKLASAAAEANKLVTVTARVKRSTTDVAAGIYIPGFNEMVPGYTADITQSCSSTATYELLTITFTPTADCVFDVMAYFRPINASTPDVIWDTLTISQAA